MHYSFAMLHFRISDEESEKELQIEEIQQEEKVMEPEIGLNDEIFGFLQKMKEKERIKLVRINSS